MNTLQLKENFKYRLIGNSMMESSVFKTLRHFPAEIAQYVSQNCWFISSFEDGWAFVLSGKDIKKNESIVFLSDELLRESESVILYTIAHEIGHIILGHRNSIGKVQSKKEIRKQEKEAHEFVKKYFSAKSEF